MRLEMAKDDGPAILERLAVFDCIDKDLAGSRAAIDRGDSRSAVIETINKMEIPRHTYESDAYHAAEASGVLGRLDPERLDKWNYPYAPIPVLDRIAEREFFDATNLHAIRNAAGPLSETEQLKINEAVESLRRDNVAMVREASQATRGLRNQRVVLDATRMGEITNELTRSSALAPCAGKLTTLLQ
jgi:hypothetical protein